MPKPLVASACHPHASPVLLRCPRRSSPRLSPVRFAGAPSTRSRPLPIERIFVSMAQVETAALIAERRMVTAAAVVEGRADLSSYPFKHLNVHCYNKFRGDGVRLVTTAVEVLAQYGWELVNLSEFTGNQLYAFLRRR